VGILARSGRNLAAGGGSVNDRRRLSGWARGASAKGRDLPAIVGFRRRRVVRVRLRFGDCRVRGWMRAGV
jgi:hypothetical protein